MNSWDIFDTLIGRRVLDPHSIPRMARDSGVEEFTIELKLGYPIAENVSQVRPDDILISDMHLPQETIARLVREVTGLINRVIVTPDGKATGRLWREVRSQESGVRIEKHTGDNILGDFDRPREHGIPAALYTGAALTAAEREILNAGFPRVALAMREGRLRTFDPEHRELELAQTQINFPLLYLAALKLRPALEGKRVLASSRDAWLWLPLLRAVARCDAVYWWSSRLCRAFPSADYLDYTEQLLFPKPDTRHLTSVLLDLCGTGWSLRRMAAALAARPKPETRNPKPELWMLAYCGDAMNQHYENLRATTGEVRWLIHSANQGLEHQNTAPHAMLSDVNGSPVWFNPTGYDWALSPQIAAQGKAFRTAWHALQATAETAEPEPPVELLASLAAELPEAAWLPREDRWVQEELRRLGDADGAGSLG